jgi:hypothetical protein
MLNFTILMGQNLALSDDFRPRDIRVFFPESYRYVSGCFTYYFDMSFDRASEHPV